MSFLGTYSAPSSVSSSSASSSAPSVSSSDSFLAPFPGKAASTSPATESTSNVRTSLSSSGVSSLAPHAVPAPVSASSSSAVPDGADSQDGDMEDLSVEADDDGVLSGDNSAPDTPASLSASSSLAHLPFPKDSIPSDPAYRHPLHQPWTLHWNPDQVDAQGWDHHVRKVMDVSSVEEFWGLFNQFAKPSFLPAKFDLHFFLKGVKPAWEDPANNRGGKWVMEYKETEEEQYNNAWLYTCLALIGEQFTDANEVMGVVVGSRKKKGRIAIWTRTSHDPDVCKRVGREWKSIALIPTHVKIGFSTHKEAMSGKYPHEQRAKFEV